MSCTQHTSIPKFEADLHLKSEEKYEFLSSIIHYMGKLAPEATYQTRFSEEFDEYYRKLAGNYTLEFYFKPGNGKEIYFLTTIEAPSLYGKRTATAGVVHLDDGHITFYEEKFRTWKMVPDELSVKSELLFSKLIQGEDLSPYYTKNSGGVEYIEFPNEHTSFDTVERKWVTTLFNPAEVFRNARL
ncbi:MAG: hypothetical protein JJU13_04300 [Balneolaceae bacterium]|nr:hypothetical protein [Balneolaceae bacterium]